ncbi:MAG TPA: Bax inhibitor-1/YccA family protein, partial [Candidatus Limnocylindrales bacterium]|nr:Bax inhibitor-1/YccA family protein [Candidatus Limnocylindrales bacterium]
MTFQSNQGGGLGQPGDAYAMPRPDAAVQSAFLTQAFFWMFAGLLLTAAVAALTQFNQGLLNLAADMFIVLIIGQLILAIGIQALIGRMSATLALGLFFVYAASLGLTIGLIVGLYTTASVATAFLSASAMFGAAALYGYTTKRNLAGIGGMAYMAMVGLFVAFIVNFFLNSDAFGYILSVAGVIIFTVLTAWDVQRI